MAEAKREIRGRWLPWSAALLALPVIYLLGYGPASYAAGRYFRNHYAGAPAPGYLECLIRIYEPVDRLAERLPPLRRWEEWWFALGAGAP